MNELSLFTEESKKSKIYFTFELAIDCTESVRVQKTKHIHLSSRRGERKKNVCKRRNQFVKRMHTPSRATEKAPEEPRRDGVREKNTKLFNVLRLSIA